MNRSVGQIEGLGAGAVDLLAQRCAELDVFVWRIGTGAQCWAEPVGGHPLGGLICSQWMSGEVVRGVGRDAGEMGGLVEVSPGVLVAVVGRDEARQFVTVLVLLTPAFEPTSPMIDCAGAADGVVREEGLKRLRRYEGEAARAVVQSARWMLDDLVRAEENERVILGFSRELMDSYEQIGLLYRLGRLMSGGTPPERFVTELCDELAQSTQFGWVAAVFDERTGHPGAIACCSGEGKKQSERFMALQNAMEPLVERLGGSKSAILDPANDSVAGALGSELAVRSIGMGAAPEGVLVGGHKRGESPQISSVETQLFEAAAEFMSVFLDNSRMYEEQRRLFMGTLQALTSSIDAKDRYTCGHSERVALLGVMLSEAMGYDAAFIEDVRIAGLVHDVGKIGVPEYVLQKPGKLTAEEFGLIQQHPEIGCGILRDVPQFSRMLPGVLSHHERWDGGGYPHGLSGEGIPLIARVLSVADTFDAMSSTRSYREAMPREVVLKEMLACAGSQLDPRLVPVFAGLSFKRYDEAVRRHAERYRQAA